MQISEFDYDLPADLIAQHPTKTRGDSRMMVLWRDTGRIEHRHFSELATFLSPNDLVVLNNTKVLPVRLRGQRPTGAQIEAVLTQQEDANKWQAIVKKAGRIKVGEVLEFENNQLQATALELLPQGKWILDFHVECLRDTLLELGRPPLPPYIKREIDDKYRDEDVQRYQCLFAQHEGAVAVPTAGMHFNEQTFAQLEQTNIDVAELTLHVGEGTFKPVEVDDISEHQMHAEYFIMGQEATDKINLCKKNKSRVIAVGSTSLRTMETAAARQWGQDFPQPSQLTAMQGETDLFICPPYDFKIAGGLLTNFHLPKSSLLILLAAFAGFELFKRSYELAIEQKYRFYSYGDCMLIL